MPPLTWRDVAAPDFSTSLGALRLAGASMDRGFSGASDALGKFNEWNQGQNASALMANALKYQNPDDLRAALANGSIYQGVDTSALTPQALGAANGQVASLLNDSINSERLKYDQQADPARIRALNTAATLGENTLPALSAKPGLDNLQTQANTGFTRANTGLVGAQTAAANIANAQSQVMNPLKVEEQKESNAGRVIGNAASGLSLTQGLRNDQDDLASRPFITQLQTGTLSQDDVNSLFGSPEFRALSPGAQERVIAASRGMAPGGAGGVGPGSRAIAGAALTAPSAPGTAGTQAGNPHDATFDFTPTPPNEPPLSERKLGDVLDYQRNTMIPQSGHSPVGAYQITADTLQDFGPKVLGPDWKTQGFTPENQEKLAKAIFEQSKGGNLKARWDSLPDATPGAYANKTWDQMKPLIMSGEVGYNGPTGSSNPSQDINAQILEQQQRLAAANTKAALINRNINARLGQDLAGGVADKYNETQNDHDTSVADVANRLINGVTGPGGSKDQPNFVKAPIYPGAPVERVTQAIQDVINQSGGKLSPATAGLIVGAHSEAAGWLARHTASALGGYSLLPDTEAVNAETTDAVRGTTFNTANATAGVQAIQGKLENARQEYETAIRQYTVAMKTFRGDPSKAKLIEGYQKKAADAQRVYETTSNMINSNPDNFNAQWQKGPGEQAATQPTKLSEYQAAQTAAAARARSSWDNLPQ